MDDSDQMLLVPLAILVMIGALYVACRLIYLMFDDVRVTKRRREEERAQEFRSALQRTELLADLREFGLSEGDLDRPLEDIVARVKYAADLHRQAIEGLGRLGAASGISSGT